MSIFSKDKKQTASDIELQARVNWPDADDEQLEIRRKAIAARKSEYRQTHFHLRQRALDRIDGFETAAKAATDAALARRLRALGEPEDAGFVLNEGETTRALLAFTPLASRWRELLAKDQSVQWSDLSIAEFEAGLAEFDAEDEAIRHELALRAARRTRIEAERNEQAVAARH
jgi:hypothetical protein